MLIAIMDNDPKWVKSGLPVVSFSDFIGSDIGTLDAFEDECWFELDKAAYLGDNLLVVGITADTLEHFSDRADLVFVNPDFEGERFGALEFNTGASGDQDVSTVRFLFEAASNAFWRRDENV